MAGLLPASEGARVAEESKRPRSLRRVERRPLQEWAKRAGGESRVLALRVIRPGVAERTPGSPPIVAFFPWGRMLACGRRLLPEAGWGGAGGKDGG